MKRRSASNHASPSKKSAPVRRASLAPVEAGPWDRGVEPGPREFAAETSLSTSGGDFGFPANSERRVIR